MTRDDFLSRWSRRKHQSRRGEVEEAPKGTPPAPVAAVPVAPEEPKPPEPLPPVESLTPESDFTPFMRKGIDPGLRQQALRTLFRDPRFNVMDGLDVYIDDFSKPDPIPAEWLGKLNQMARLGDYVPPEEAPDEAEKAAPEAEAEPIKPENQDLVAESPVLPSEAPEAGSPQQESQRS
jgi:hypothetical protein